MPSRKKAKGKARKAAKEAAKEEKSETAAAADQRQRQEESLGAQMQRLEISRGLLINCRHGADGTPLICVEFIGTFIPAYISKLEGSSAMDAFEAAHEATAGEKFDKVKLESVISLLVAAGTDSFLGGDIDTAQLYAVMACYFEELIAVSVVRKSKAFINWIKVFELHGADEHTLVKFLRKRIPCHCLDEKYKAVKSVKKVGICCNLKCSIPGNLVERSKMLCCTGCGVANYCSRECQKEDWKHHRKACNDLAEEKAAFQAKQS